MAGTVKYPPTARKPVCEYAPLRPCGDLVLLSGAEPLPSAAGARGDRTLGHCLLEMAQKAGRGHVLLLLDKVWQLITSNYAACGAGLAAGGSSTPLWATLGSWGASQEFPGPCFLLKSLRNSDPPGRLWTFWSGPAPAPPCPRGVPPPGR